MSTTILIVGFAVILACAFAFGYIVGLTRGISLGAHAQRSEPPSPIPWMIACLAGGVLLLCAVGTAGYSAYFLANSQTTVGTITGFDESTGEDGQKSYFPEFEYTTGTGERLAGRSSISEDGRYSVGEKVAVRYLSNSPSRSRLDSFAVHWLPPIFLTAAGIISLIVAFMLRWWRGELLAWARNRLARPGAQ